MWKLKPCRRKNKSGSLNYSLKLYRLMRLGFVKSPTHMFLATYFFRMNILLAFECKFAVLVCIFNAGYPGNNNKFNLPK